MATLDLISGGRAVLGVGVGGRAEDYVAARRAVRAPLGPPRRAGRPHPPHLGRRAGRRRPGRRRPPARAPDPDHVGRRRAPLARPQRGVGRRHQRLRAGPVARGAGGGAPSAPAPPGPPPVARTPPVVMTSWWFALGPDPLPSSTPTPATTSACSAPDWPTPSPPRARPPAPTRCGPPSKPPPPPATTRSSSSPPSPTSPSSTSSPTSCRPPLTQVADLWLRHARRRAACAPYRLVDRRDRCRRS